MTVNLSGSPTNSSIIVAEYSGLANVDILDQTASATGFTSPASTGTTAVTSQTHELWVGGLTVQNNSAFGAPTNTFTEVAESGATAGNTSFVEKVVTSTGTAGATSTYSGFFQMNVGNIVTFKAYNPALENIVLSQSGYRVFNNADSYNVGSPIAAANSPATLSSAGQAFRLRNLLHIDDGQIDISAMNFRLQFVDSGRGTWISA